MWIFFLLNVEFDVIFIDLNVSEGVFFVFFLMVFEPWGEILLLAPPPPLQGGQRSRSAPKNIPVFQLKERSRVCLSTHKARHERAASVIKCTRRECEFGFQEQKLFTNKILFYLHGLMLFCTGFNTKTGLVNFWWWKFQSSVLWWHWWKTFFIDYSQEDNTPCHINHPSNILMLLHS